MLYVIVDMRENAHKMKLLTLLKNVLHSYSRKNTKVQTLGKLRMHGTTN